MRKAAIFIVLTVISMALSGWEKIYCSDIWRGTKQTIISACDNSGFIIAGRSEGYNVFKIDTSGNIIWTKDYDDLGHFTCIESSADGNYVLSGCSEIADWRIMFCKINSIGDSLCWMDSYPIPSMHSFGNAITRLADGGFAICGEGYTPYTWPLETDTTRMFVVKTDSMGIYQWTFFDTLHSRSSGIHIVSTQDSGCVCVGKFIVKLDKFGNIEWLNNTIAEAVTRTFDGNYAITKGFGHIIVSKISVLGDSLWSKNYYGPPNSGCGYSIIQTPDSGFAVAGRVSENGGDAFLLRLDSNGDSLWMRTYGGDGDETIFKLIQTAEGSFCMVGNSTSYTGRKFYVIKTDSLGYTAVGETPTLRPLNLSLSAHPNPFNSAVKITIDAPVETQNLASLQIEIFDVNGRHIKTLWPSGTSGTGPSGLEKGGTNSALLHKGGQGGSYVWQPDESVGSGVYLVRATFGPSTDSVTETATKRVVYLK